MTVAELEDCWADPSGNRRANGYWPIDGRLRLDGLKYSRISEKHEVSVDERLGWIRSQFKPNSRDIFATQPYQQLAKAYQEAGR